MNSLTCMSCNQKIENDPAATRFSCPKCSKTEIIRCGHCRSIAAQYSCVECGFVGPN